MRPSGVPAAVLWLVAACAAPPARPAHNVASAAPRVAIAPDQALGWIGLAPRAAHDAADWLPAGAQAVLVPMPAEGLSAGATLSAIDSAGHVARVTAGAVTQVPYGCDNQQLDMLAFTGEPSAPGAVWLLPPAAPASWHPPALAIISPAAAPTADRRRDTVGPLSLELVRRGAARGTLAIARDGRVIHTRAITRGEMAGADPDPIDLRRPGVAIPEPVAAWSVAEDGPILLVLQIASYEGVHLTPILVEADRAHELPAMAVYLYRCAF